MNDGVATEDENSDGMNSQDHSKMEEDGVHKKDMDNGTEMKCGDGMGGGINKV